jgi:hypothetical protein
MNDVRLDLIEQGAEALIDALPSISVASIPDINDVQGDARIVGVTLANDRFVGRKGVLATGEDVDLVARRERLREALGVDLRARIEPHRISVNDLKYAHEGTSGDRLTGTQRREPGHRLQPATRLSSRATYRLSLPFFAGASGGRLGSRVSQSCGRSE